MHKSQYIADPDAEMPDPHAETSEPDGDRQDDDRDVEVDVPGKPAAGRRRCRVASGDGDGQDDNGDMETERLRLPGLFSWCLSCSAVQ